MCFPLVFSARMRSVYWNSCLPIASTDKASPVATLANIMRQTITVSTFNLDVTEQHPFCTAPPTTKHFVGYSSLKSRIINWLVWAAPGPDSRTVQLKDHNNLPLYKYTIHYSSCDCRTDLNLSNENSLPIIQTQ